MLEEVGGDLTPIGDRRPDCDRMRLGEAVWIQRQTDRPFLIASPLPNRGSRPPGACGLLGHCPSKYAEVRSCRGCPTERHARGPVSRGAWVRPGGATPPGPPLDPER
jgi:hypothetical protein